ncbi:hypothetical protein NKH77_34795 [Streptomyces sp. M19]
MRFSAAAPATSATGRVSLRPGRSRPRPCPRRPPQRRETDEARRRRPGHREGGAGAGLLSKGPGTAAFALSGLADQRAYCAYA